MSENTEQDIFEDRCHPAVVRFGTPHWREDNTCAHCGGIRPSIAMKHIREGAEVTPTDKSYKIYVDVPDPKVGQMRVVSTMNFTPTDYNPEDRGYVKADPEVLKASGWGTGDSDYSKGIQWMMLKPHDAIMNAKCYLNHFSESQALEFVRLIETKKMNIAFPGHFYRNLAFGRYKEAIEKLWQELHPVETK